MGHFRFFKNGAMSICWAILIVILDQLSKNWILDLLKQGLFIDPITSFFNIVERWNKGISFGILGAQALSPWIFICFSLLVSIVLVVWSSREENSLSRLALGLIIGGALSNSFDRFKLGAVFDFLEFHLGKYYWPAFNIADSAIVLGVILLFLISVLKNRECSEAKGNNNVS